MGGLSNRDVMAGLVPAIHVGAAATVSHSSGAGKAERPACAALPAPVDVDARDRPGHDGKECDDEEGARSGPPVPYSRNDTSPWRTAWSSTIQMIVVTIVV